VTATHRKERRSIPFVRFAGISLGGGKGRRTCLAVLDYYPKEKKVFLSELIQGIEEEKRISADTHLIRKLESFEKNLKLTALDGPLKLPKCMRCELVCPGHEKCTESEIRWMWKRYKKRDPKKRPNRIFTPYTERCVEQYILSEVHQDLATDHALGANRAPIAARAMYLQRRLGEENLIEVSPKLSLWRLGAEVGLRKNHILAYRQQTKGEDVRQRFLDAWSEQDRTFFYHRDFKLMVKEAFAFDAFLAAYTAFLKHQDLCEEPPKGFPKNEAWIAFPKKT